ncbi:MAG: hypothetical protein WBP12_03990 [Candidatus Saccharimonas sp.]
MDIERKRPNAAVISIVVIVLIGIAAGAVYAANANKQSNSEQTSTSSEQSTATDSTSTTSESTPTSNSEATTATSSYKDGSYTATGNYTTPGGGESITVTVTLSGSTISDISASGSASRGDSAQYQSKFLSGYKAQVVGKSIDSVSLSRVSGSSLTSNGFNAAIKKIKDEAVS